MPSFSSLSVAWIVVFVGLILARGPYVWHPWSKPDNNIFSLLFNRLLFFYLSPVIILVSSYLVCSHCTFSIWIHSEHTKHALPVRQRYPLSVTLPVFWDRHCPEANLWYWVILKFYVSVCDNIKPKSGPWCPFSRLAKSHRKVEKGSEWMCVFIHVCALMCVESTHLWAAVKSSVSSGSWQLCLENGSACMTPCPPSLVSFSVFCHFVIPPCP